MIPAAFTFSHHRNYSDLEGWLAFASVIALAAFAVYFAVQRVKKLRFYRRNTQFFLADVQSVESYSYEENKFRHTRYVIYFSWIDGEAGLRESNLETSRPFYAAFCRKRGKVRIAVIRDRNSPVYLTKQAAAENPLLSPEEKRVLQQIQMLRQEKDGDALMLPAEEILLGYQRRLHTYYAVFYFICILIPILLVPLMILFGFYLYLHQGHT